MNWFSWALLSAFFAGLTAVLAKAGVSGVNSNLAAAVRTTVVLIMTWATVFIWARPGEITYFSKRAWIYLTLSGLATGLSWLCYFRALQLGQASRVAPIDKLSVVVAVALAALWLGERLTWQHYVGGALIVAGALVLAIQ